MNAIDFQDYAGSSKLPLHYPMPFNQKMKSIEMGKLLELKWVKAVSNEYAQPYAVVNQNGVCD